MFGEQYQVDYIINLQDNASAGIIKFSSAATKLANATKKFDLFTERFNKMTATFNKQLELKISTSQASRKLNRVIKQLERIDGLSKGINLGVAGGVRQSGGAANRRNTATPMAAPMPRQPRVIQPQGPRPIVAPRGRQPLVPRNLEYQVLGPTRLGNVAMLDMFKGMGLMYGISAVGSGLRDIISQSTEYENIMQTAKNILKTNYKGANFNVSFNDMERIVREVGVETKFTAPEVADAVKFLAMAGLDINAISKSIRPIADIALIGDTDLGQTADVMTNIMTAYGIKPDDMRKTADVMTRTFTMSNTTLLELAESFKMAGSMLHLANVPFETAAAAFGVLGDAGIKATMAGTTMRTIMNNLRNPTKNQQKYWDMLGIRRYDEYGNLREINEIFADLNKLNGNDARSARAKTEYDALQKKYAPKLEGLQEGSVEYNKVLAEYDKESEAIRKQFGGVDVFRLFRLTAASGAGVLMNSVEKWNKIIEENFLSQGLSNKLAEQKKNTIAGLWAQLKSAFQEGGLKVFQENDSRIRGYLQGAISWLKSDQFTNILRNVIDLVADLGKTLLTFTKYIIDLYEKFGPLIKRFLQFQLYAKGIQTILVSIRQFSNTALLAALPILNRLGGKRMPVIASGNAVASVASGVGTGTIGGMLYYGIPQKRMGNGYRTLLETGDPWQAVKADKNYQKSGFGAVANNRRLLNRYTAVNKRIQAMNQWSGRGMIGGSILGGMIGNNFDEENGMMWGSLIGGGLGSLAPLLAGSGPWGWVIGGAAVAITGLVSAYVKYNRQVAKAKEETDRFIGSLRTLNIDKVSLGSADDVFNANIRITTSLLHTENEKLNLQLQLLRRLRDEKEGTPDAYDANTGTEVVQEVKGYRDKYWKNGVLWTTERRTLIDELTDKGILAPAGDERYSWYTGSRNNYYEITDGSGNSVKYRDITGEYEDSLETVNSFSALKAAFNPDNPFLNQAKTTWLKLSKHVTDVESYNQAVSQFWSKLNLPEMTHVAGEIDDLKDSDFDAMLADNSLMAYPEYRIPMNKQLEEFVMEQNSFKKFIETVEGFDFGAQNLTLPMKEAQEYLGSRIPGPYFDESKFGVFGTPEWVSKMVNYANTAKDDKGAPYFNKGSEGYDWANEIQNIYELFLGFFRNLPDELKPFYYPYLNKTYWESLGGKVNLGELEGMYQPKDEQEAASLYPNLTFGSFGGHPAWFDNGSLVVPGFWAMPQIGGNVSQNQVQTPEQTVNSVSESLQAYAPKTVQMWPNGVPNTPENPVAQDSTLVNAVKEFAAPSVALANANVVPWREAVDRISYHSPWEPVTREEVDRATAEPLYAAFAPSYTPFMPPLSQTAVNNEDFRPAERQQVAMVARPVVININAERLVDFGTLNIENATDDAEIAQKVRNALEGILAEVAESTGGNYHFGVAS